MSGRSGWLAVGIGIAVAVLVAERQRAPELSPLDFAAGGPQALEFCDPAHPRFLAVQGRQSPVELAQRSGDVFTLRTQSGKPIGPKSLVGARLKLYAVNADATQFAAATAQPTAKLGEWRAKLPAGLTKVFADFTPSATGQEMYVEADLPFGGEVSHENSINGLKLSASGPLAMRQQGELLLISDRPINTAEVAVFDLRPAGPTGFLVHAADKIDVAAHKAHFDVTFNDPGRYIAWALAGERGLDGESIAGGEKQVRLAFTVSP